MKETEIYKCAGFYGLDPEILLDMNISGLPAYLEGLQLRNEEQSKKWAIMLESILNKLESLIVLTNNLHNKRRAKYKPVNIVDALPGSEKQKQDEYHRQLIARRKAKRAAKKGSKNGT